MDSQANIRKKWTRAALICLASLLAAIAAAQEIKKQPGPVSSGSIGIRLQKFNNGQGSIVVSVPGKGKLPTLLPEQVTTALANKRNASFPLCVTGAGSASGISIAQVPSANGSQTLMTSSGSRVSYSVGVSSNSKGKQTSPTTTSTCNGGALVQVDVSLEGRTSLTPTALYGAIPILIITE